MPDPGPDDGTGRRSAPILDRLRLRFGRGRVPRSRRIHAVAAGLRPRPGSSSMAVVSVGGVSLGAGASRRLGRSKQALPLGDTTLLGWVVREAEASLLDRIVVITRGDIHTGRAVVARPEARDTTCSASLKAGLAAVGACDAVMLLRGDTPEVDASG